MSKNFKRNLLAGFGASLLILVISSAASFISIQNLLNSAGLVNHTNTVILEMDGINAAILDAETGQRGYLLAGEDEFLQPYIDAKARTLDAYAKVKQLTIDNPAQQKSLEELGRLIEQRFTYLQVNIEARRDNKELKPESLRKGRDIMQQIRSIIKLMESRERDLLTERTSSMNQFASFTPVLIIVAAMIALLITVLFYVRVRNDFEDRLQLQQALQRKDEETTNRINIIKSIADKISQGSYETRVNDSQSDSLGSVAGSLNKMAQSLQYSFGLLSDKEWMQTGIAKLNDVMIGEKNLETLTRHIIDFLATYSNSHAGVLYITERDSLYAVAGYAYAPDKNREKFKMGEGLIGQAVVAGKVLQLKEIPAESIYISFATGQAKPRHIVAVPIFDGYTVKGGIELASLDKFTEREIEFLQNSAHNIGIAITTAQNRKKLQELLEETQAQAEELTAQHSELENLNSELEVQAEKLQASEEELKVQQEELKEANQELEERSRLLEEKNQLIIERNTEIQAKADQLMQSARYKSEFLANMSHELRTPLNSILLLSRLLTENQDKNLSTDQVEYARVIQSSGNGLLSLIDEILDLSKIEAGKMQLEYQSVSLQEVAQDMKALFTPVAQEKNIELRTQLKDGVPDFIETDKLRLEQIIRNLLSNATKFTANGYVSFEIEKDADDPRYIRFIVRDTGIGIPQDKQQLIFEAFQQADGSTRRRFGGTGLGLSISRNLARLLGGEITLRSEVDQGSEFAVTIPVKKIVGNRALPEPEKIAVETPKPQQNAKSTVSEKYVSTTIPESIPDDRKNVKPGDKVMLIIEDDINFAKSLLDYTRKRGYKGIVAVRGDEGIMLAKQFSPHGVLLDIQLPVKSGWEVMEELKGDIQTRHIPVHIMSSHEVKSESLTKGAVDFINKPVAFEKLQEIFKKIEYVLTHHPKKVLIVEENARHAKALAYFLETFDVNIEINGGVNDAIKSLQSADVDCVILDMGIPDQKSYDTLEEVKKTPGLENLPIIIFTGKSLSQAEELRIKQYADSIVVKTAHSYKRILDEVSLFLHLMEKHDTPQPSNGKYAKLGAMDEVLHNKTVLIADDDMRNIFSLTKALEKYKMKVLAAVDGKDALKQLSNNPEIDIVLMDMMMPEMDGYESTALIRKDPRFKYLPVIAVTAKAMVGDRIKCINAGASDYITKPVDVDQLISLLRVWLYEKTVRS